MKQHFFLFAVLTITFLSVAGQGSPKVKYGKVSDEDLNMRIYAPDTSAVAVILHDEGYSTVSYELSKKRFMLDFQRFVRIKILKQSGTDWGNLRISLFSFGQSKEVLMNVDGTTYNLENGKVEKSVLKRDAIFQERENKYWEVARISLPSVKEGSVIDLKYSINSPLLWNLQTWTFQYAIPVKWSQYYVSYPEYFNYNHSSQGYHWLNSKKQSTKSETINFVESVDRQGSPWMGGGREQTARSISFMSNVYEYSAKDVPAIKEEPFCTTIENFTTRLKFELSSIDFTKVGGEFKSYTNSWGAICDGLLDDADFGGQINAGNFAESLVADLIKGKNTDKEKAVAVYSYIQNNIRWDNFISISTSKSLKKTVGDKTGNSADINLLLLTMLRQAGLKADPVILSIRSHGLISPVHPSLSDCNYVIVCTRIDDKPFFMDATEPSLPAGELPIRCMNGDGVLVSKTSAGLIPLTVTPAFSSISVMLEMKENKLSGNLLAYLYGKDAYDFREGVKDAGGPQAYFEKKKNSTNEIEYTDFRYEQLDSLHLPVRKKYGIILKSDLDEEASMIYLNPIVGKQMEKNPFSAPTRIFPVDFGVPFSEKYMFHMAIPQGYMVEELPQSKNIVLGDKDGVFTYSIAQAGDRINLVMRLSIEKAMFLPAEYPDLKSFFDLVVAKQAEHIVLKKID